jgi:palmitoyl transferase
MIFIMHSFTLAIALACSLLMPPAYADEAPGETDSVKNPQGWWSRIESHSRNTWRDGQPDLFVPLRTWHNRLAYSQQSIASFNEQPWGIGLGKSRTDGDDWHAVYAMAFLDSHRDVEPFAGYAFEKIRGNPAGWHAGFGYTVGFSARESYGYIPFPILLPLASAGYSRLEIQATYIPGGKDWGNVLFIWLHLGL